MPWTISTSRSIILKAGSNANTDVINSGTIMAIISDLAEAALTRDTEYDYVSNATLLTSRGTQVCIDATSDYAAKFVIENKMGGYTNNGEAVTMVNILIDNYGKAVSKLKDKNIQALLRGGV